MSKLDQTTPHASEPSAVGPNNRATTIRAADRVWLSVFLVALAYFVSGRLGQMLAVPPAYPTAVWPPSGIALAAALIFGMRIWPGIFLGAVLVNAWTPLAEAPTISDGIRAMGVPSLIGIGATMQALLGAWLVRRTVGYPNPLIHDRQILAFLFLTGPVSCLVGSSWGVASLSFAGELNDPVDIALNWWTWWVGDVIGVIIFGPLTLICFGTPRTAWRPRWTSVAVPLIGAIAATILGFIFTQLIDERRERAQFEGIAVNSHHLLKSEVTRHIGLLDSLQRYFDNSQFINRKEFAEFNRDNRERFPAARMVAWLPRELTDPDPLPAREVSGDQGPESDLAEKGKLANAIEIQRLSDGSPEADFTGKESFNAAYVHPAKSPFLSVGDDFAALPNWHALMQLACDDSCQVASEPFLATGSGDVRHVLVLAPVFERDTDPLSEHERRQKLRGYLVAAFDASTLVRIASPARDSGMFELDIDDVTEAAEARMVFVTPQLASAHKESEVAPLLRRGPNLSSEIEFANRTWLCRYRPTDRFLRVQTNRRHWSILASGLALTGMLGAFLMILSGRTARIEASELLYLDLYENAPDMFISLDVATQRVVECNRTFLEMTGFARNQVLDQHMYDLFAADSRTEARRAFRTFLQHGHVSDIELQLMCHDGTKVDISMKMSAVLDESGHSVKCRAALRDITARKKVEADLMNQERELAHVARLSMMGEMAAGLAHEINQPLGAIAAYAEGAAIRLRDGKPDPQSLTLVLDRIAGDAHRAGQVIRRLRQFLRKRTPEKTHVQINDLVREVAQFVDADLRRRNVRLGIELDPNLPRVHGDPIQIQQVLLNLVRNGCDAMNETDAPRRSLLIRTHSADGETVDVAVDDCGHGLVESPNDQLFEAFFSTKDDGLGLGLAISRSIIESHNGEIWATPNLEGGASFHFSLPAATEVLA